MRLRFGFFVFGTQPSEGKWCCNFALSPGLEVSASNLQVFMLFIHAILCRFVMKNVRIQFLCYIDVDLDYLLLTVVEPCVHVE